MTTFNEALGIDVGAKRIGVARVNAVARIPAPVQTVTMDENAPLLIKEIADRENADIIVVGVPITESGTDSEQTLYCREFAVKLETVGLNVVLQDETLSTNAATELIKNQTYSKNALNQKPGIDEVAACVILSDYIKSQ